MLLSGEASDNWKNTIVITALRTLSVNFHPTQTIPFSIQKDPRHLLMTEDLQTKQSTNCDARPRTRRREVRCHGYPFLCWSVIKKIEKEGSFHAVLPTLASHIVQSGFLKGRMMDSLLFMFSSCCITTRFQRTRLYRIMLISVYQSNKSVQNRRRTAHRRGFDYSILLHENTSYS